MLKGSVNISGAAQTRKSQLTRQGFQKLSLKGISHEKADNPGHSSIDRGRKRVSRRKAEYPRFRR